MCAAHLRGKPYTLIMINQHVVSVKIKMLLHIDRPPMAQVVHNQQTIWVFGCICDKLFNSEEKRNVRERKDMMYREVAAWEIDDEKLFAEKVDAIEASFNYHLELIHKYLAGVMTHATSKIERLELMRDEIDYAIEDYEALTKEIAYEKEK